MRRGAITALSLAMMLLASCVPKPSVAPPGQAQRPSATPTPSATIPYNAVAAGVRPAALPAIDESRAQQVIDAFRTSCPQLLKRTDATGMTQPADWSAACAFASDPANRGTISLSGFIQRFFEPVQVGSGEAFATGYFEPQIRGSRTPGPGYPAPVYAKPPDLLETNPLTGEKGRGRIDERGAYVLYYDRGAIYDGALANRGLEIGWAADPIELFFLQIQGSGRLLLPDGGVMRIGYAGQNGREYVAIGRTLRERGLLQPGQANMQGIIAWLRANPEEGRAIMRENKSYIFFRELTGPGPLGALGVPVSPRVTVAADPAFVPLGAMVLLAMDRPEASGPWVAQDTGGAIKGTNRFDTFWGAGEDAARIAGGMQAGGSAVVLVPRGTLARLGVR
ncbi:membrane-bound lytic murein transglycosylase A [Allosphingosinicella indica]|uniref:peptidoglycan lytic exotransglycosylase n=2 Tax=Allosphingosinicella indica TaxID=941907 RepID=A0A1X7FYR7_9SPHN|nr:membrane-bound lytic murein transglycosylase A [Allosphingosinicella indica]